MTYRIDDALGRRCNVKISDVYTDYNTETGEVQILGHLSVLDEARSDAPAYEPIVVIDFLDAEQRVRYQTRSYYWGNFRKTGFVTFSAKISMENQHMAFDEVKELLLYPVLEE